MVRQARPSPRSPRASIEHPLPTVGEEDEGLWWLHFTDGAQGPFPSAHAAWDYWHGNPPTLPGPRRRRRRGARMSGTENAVAPVSG